MTTHRFSLLNPLGTTTAMTSLRSMTATPIISMAITQQITATTNPICQAAIRLPW